MEAIKQNIIIPESHDLDLQFHIPDHIPTGEAEILIIIQPTRSVTEKKKRSLGTMKGLVSTSSDFDSELPDNYWLGE